MTAVRIHVGRRRFAGALVAVAAIGAPTDALASGPPASGGAGLPPAIGTSGGGSLASVSGQSVVPPAASSAIPPPPVQSARGRWFSGMAISEYWPAPESWFTGALVGAPGLPGKHRVDWLYSAEGISMNGEGIGLDGRMYHLAALGAGGWVTAAGKPTDAAKGWDGGPPAWRSGGYWRDESGDVTYPLQTGGWSGGTGVSYVPLEGVTFAPGPALPLRAYQSIVAQDTGGAIVGHRIDVYRTPPATPGAGGQHLVAQRVFVAAPGTD